MTLSETAPHDTDLPEGWGDASVLDLADLIRGVSYAKGEAQTAPYPGSVTLLRANNIADGIVFEDMQYVPTERVSDAQRLRVGDVIVAMSSGSKAVVGKAASVCQPFDRTFGAFCGVLRPTPAVNASFFGTHFQTRDYRKAISEASAGTNINNLKREYFADQRIPLPPLAEQRRIVAQVEALLARVQADRARLAKVPALLKRFRQSVLAAAFCGQLTTDWREKSGNGPIASGHNLCSEPDAELVDVAELTDLPRVWGLAPLDDFRDVNRTISYGVLKPGPYVEDGIPLLRILDILSGSADTKDVHRISPELSNQYRRTVLHGGEVLVSLVGTIGRVAIVPEALVGANVHRNLAVVAPAPNVLGKYLYYALSAPPVQRQIEHLTTGANQPLFNLGDLRRLAIPAPSLDEQHEIVLRLDALFALADKIEARVAAATQRVEKITQAILAKAFRGELVPTEAELARQEGRDYEPASVLLERIRAERDAAPPRPPTAGKRSSSNPSRGRRHG